MNCDQFNKTLDDYLDGNVDDQAAFDAHADSCGACAASRDAALTLKNELVELARRDAPADPAFVRAALARAPAPAATGRRRDWLRGFGTALAACAALFAVFLFVDGADETATVPADVPSIAMTLEQPRTVNLVFASATALEQATMTVSLPDGVALQGFEGQREVTWSTSLAAGRNVLPLTLIATTPAGGELLATLRHGADDKSFRVRLTIA